MSYNLFLDDIREPDMAANYMPPPTNSWYITLNWVVVRSYDEFIQYIKKNGLPSMISFDHDLGEDEAERLRLDGISKHKARSYKKTVKSGFDCAKWLCYYCMDNDLELPHYLVHSQNPVGAENIASYLENFKKFY
jgi:hypothetical protein